MASNLNQPRDIHAVSATEKLINTGENLTTNLTNKVMGTG